MGLERDVAICLGWKEFSETSQIVRLLTRGHGLVNVLVKGAKRTTLSGASRFSGGIDVLDVGDALLIYNPVRVWSQLTEWTLLDGHFELRWDFRRLCLGQFVAELVLQLFEQHDPVPQVFDDVTELLGLLCRSDEPHRRGSDEAPALVTVLRLLHAGGILPNLATCGVCGRSVDDDEPGVAAACFSLPLASAVCDRCRGQTDGLRVVSKTLLRLASRLVQTAVAPASGVAARHGSDVGRRALHASGVGRRVAIAQVKLPKLTHHQTQPLLMLLGEFVAYQQGREFRSLRVLPASLRFISLRCPPPNPLEPFMPPLPPCPSEPAIAEETRSARRRSGRARQGRSAADSSGSAADAAGSGDTPMRGYRQAAAASVDSAADGIA